MGFVAFILTCFVYLVWIHVMADASVAVVNQTAIATATWVATVTEEQLQV